MIELPTFYYYAKIDHAGKTDNISVLRIMIGNNRCISGFVEKAEIKDEKQICYIWTVYCFGFGVLEFV